MRILCLSRAPLDFNGGIPAYCLTLYSKKKFNVINYSYDLSKKIKKIIQRDIQGIKEYIFPSQIVMGTLAFSFQYLLYILKKTSEFDVIHVQHPDPFSSASSLLAKLLNPKIKLIQIL